MKLRTVDSPGIKKPKAKLYFFLKVGVCSLIALCIAVGVIIKAMFFPEYNQVLDDLCIAIQEWDSLYMKNHIPRVHGEDNEKDEETQKQQEDKWEEDKEEQNGYISDILFQMTGEEILEEENIDYVGYEILEKHKMKSWDISQEQENSEKSTNKNMLEDYIENGFVDTDTMGQEESGFSDYAYQYKDTFWGTQKLQKVFDKENVYMLLVDFSISRHTKENTFQAIVYIAKAKDRWVLLAIENLDDYESIMYEEDEE